MAEFRSKAEAAGLKKETITKLIRDDIDSEDVVSLLSADDVKSLVLSTGQTLVLKRWIQTLKPTDDEAASVASATHDDGGLSELLSDDNNTVPVTGKPLYPCDFVGGPSFPDRDTTVCAQGTSRLVLRAGRNHVTPEQLTLAQWVSANARVMSRLIREGSLTGQDELCSYLDFIESVGNYAQVNTTASVMLYDHEFRRKQAEKNRPWDCEDFHLVNFILQKKESTAEYRPRAGRQGNPSPSVEICRNFNGHQGCVRDNCRYAHVCIVCKKPGHNGMTHRSTQQLDPKAGAFVPSLPNTNYRR